MSRPESLLNPSEPTPPGIDLAQDPGWIWLHAGSDALILLSCLSIPIYLLRLLWCPTDCAGRCIGHLFAALFLAFAMTYGLAIVTPWLPVPGLEGIVTAGAALISVAAAAMIWFLSPRFAALTQPAPSPGLAETLSDTIARQQTTIHEMTCDVMRHAAELEMANARLLEVSAESRATRDLLARSAAEIQASFDGTIVGRIQMEPLSGTMLRVNSAFANMLGYEPMELVGRPIWDVAYPDDRAAAQARFSQLLAREIDRWVVEKRFVRRDGVPVWVRISATVVIDPALGLPRLVLAEVEDLDMRQDIHAGLRTIEARLRQALETAGIGIWEVDIARRMFWTDHRAQVVTGGEVPANTWLALDGPRYAAWEKRIHPEDRDRRTSQLQAFFTGAAETVQIEFRALDADGGWLHLSHRCAIVERDPETGAPLRAVGIIMELTESLAALAEAKRAKASLEQTIEGRDAALAHRHCLLREIYHRMDDSLGIVDRLFLSQAHQRTDQGALDALTEQHSRIYTLGAIHHALMTPLDVETFDLAPFLRNLCAGVLAHRGGLGVSLHVNCGHLKVTLDHVVLLGALVTELLINGVRHACVLEDGKIVVTAQGHGSAAVALTMSHGGTGSADPGRAASFQAGLETWLVQDLAYQLGAELKICVDEGLSVEIAIDNKKTILGSPDM